MATDVIGQVVVRLGVEERRLKDGVPPAPENEAWVIDRMRPLSGLPPTYLCLEREETSGQMVAVRVPLTLHAGPESRPICDTCDEGIRGCHHVLRALDAVRRTLQTASVSELDRLRRQLEEPTWRSWLKELAPALDTLAEVRTARQRSALWWRLDPEAYRIHVYVASPADDEAAPPAQAVRLDAAEARARLDVRDHAAWLATRAFQLERRAAARDDRLCHAFSEALSSFVDHPRVWVGPEAEGSPWAVARARLEARLHPGSEGGLALGFSADGLDLDPKTFGRTRVAPRQLFIQSETRRLAVLELDEATIGLLSTWAQNQIEVPPEGQAELLSRLSRVSRHLSLGLAPGINEVRVPASAELILMMRPAVDGTVVVQIRARPLEDGPLLEPGVGPEAVVTASADRDIVRTTRNLDLESEFAHSLVRKLALPSPDERWTMVLELEDAIEVLEAVPELGGVSVQFPEKRLGSVVPVEAKHLHLQAALKRDWLGLKGYAGIDGRRIELAVLLEAARRDRGVALADDGTVLQLQPTLLERLRALHAHLISHRGSGLGLARSGLDAVLEALDGTASGRQDAAFRDWVQRREEALKSDPLIPPELRADLRPYQKDGFQWMARLSAFGAGGLLADDMGLGKTVQAIALLLQRSADGPALVVAPTSVGFNWRRELARFAPCLEVRDYSGPQRVRHLESLGPGHVLVTSYGVAVRDIARLRETTFSSLILDEIQALKNPHSQRSRALRRLSAEWAVGLTGTPVENTPTELWSLFAAVYPSLLGSLEAFKSRFAQEPSPEGPRPAVGTATLRRAIRPYLLRRTKLEVAPELPPKTEMRVDVVLSERERALYEDARLAALAGFKKESVAKDNQLRFWMLATLTRLRQLACHPRLVDADSRVPSSKLERFLGIIEDLRSEGRRALVFSQFTAHLALIRKAVTARKWTHLYLDGSTPAPERARMVDAFQSGAQSMFLISLKAGGTGLNLTEADTVIHLDPWWNPAVEDQATDRAHRIGQARPVTVIRLVTQDTIESDMLEMNRSKRALVDALLEGASEPAKLSSQDLYRLIKGTA